MRDLNCLRWSSSQVRTTPTENTPESGKGVAWRTWKVEKKEDRGRWGESKNCGCEINSSYCSEIEGFFFFCQKPCVEGGIWNSCGRGPWCKQQYWFYRDMVQLWCHRFCLCPLKDQTDSGGAKILGIAWLCLISSSHGGRLFLLTKPQRESQGNRVCCFYSFQRLSEDTQLHDGRFPLLAAPVKRCTGITT